MVRFSGDEKLIGDAGASAVLAGAGSHRVVRQTSGRLIRLRLFVLFSLLALGSTVEAFTFQPSMKDFYIYPAYCKAKLADFHRNRAGQWRVKLPINEQQVAYWREVIGPDWRHMHHFCAGLTYISKANDSMLPPPARRTAWGRAVEEISYTRGRSAPGHPFWEQMSLKYAEALGGAGRFDEAMGVLTELRAQNPKGVDAYVLQARLLKGKGKMDEAMALLKAGLDAGAKRGPLLFYLAEYYFDTGDFEAAQKFATEANAAGMKMDRLWSKLPESYGGRGD